LTEPGHLDAEAAADAEALMVAGVVVYVAAEQRGFAALGAVQQ